MARLEEARAGPSYRSRKNNVFPVETGGELRVAKVFSQGLEHRAETEYRALESCRDLGIPAPLPLDLTDGGLIMGLVQGIRASEVFLYRTGGPEHYDIEVTEELLRIDMKEMLDKISAWLAEFHASHQWEYRRGDATLGNFILADDKIYGLDFEEFGRGEVEADVADVCSYMLRHYPYFTPEKFELCGYFIDRYNHHGGRGKEDKIKTHIVRSLRHLAKYRKESQLRLTWADKIQKSDYF